MSPQSTNRPLNGEQFDYWLIDLDPPSIRHFRGTFHVNTRWAHHPWSRLPGPSRVGLDFVNQWSMEYEIAPNKFRPDGRNGADLKSRMTARGDAFFSFEDARTTLVGRAIGELEWLRRRTAELKSALRSYGSDEPPYDPSTDYLPSVNLEDQT